MPIQRDVLGNVINDGTWIYSWKGGRCLAEMSKSGATISFKYDENGQRIKKTVGSASAEYAVQARGVCKARQPGRALYLL